MQISRQHRLSPGLSVCLSTTLTLAVGATGGFATASSVTTWYAGLNKPSFNPPNWLFGPVWTVLYVLMAVAAWRVYLTPRSAARTRSLSLYGLQLALNLAWSLIFFGLRAPLSSLLELALLLAAILATALAFCRLERLAALLLAPYLAWSGFAFLLNFEIWRLNSGG